MSLKIRFFILCLVALGFCLPAWAQDDDPFGDRDDDDEQTTDSRDNIQDEGSTFSGSIEKLLDLAGEKKAAT
ncbi:MAG TPA: hypothetical protein PLP17_05095, partial [Oligoflexia bacterium]|nr:hypothetical protein [Oligoflexia bacterium]